MKSIHDPSHPIWFLLSQALILGTIYAFCSLFYNSGFVTKDLVMMIFTALAGILAELARNKMTTGDKST